MQQFQIILNRQYFILSSPHLKFSRCRHFHEYFFFFFNSRNCSNFPAMAYCAVNKHSFSFIIIIIVKSSASWPASSSPGRSDSHALQGLQLWFGTNCHHVPVRFHHLDSRGGQTFHAAGESKQLQLFIPYSHFKVFIYHSKVMICLPTGLLRAKHFYELA